jgi:hypothetical protein
MKRSNVLFVGAVMLLGLTAFAQDSPKIELAVDYSYARYSPSHAYVGNTYSLNGAGGSVDFNFTKFLGVKMELEGYGSNTQFFSAPAGSSVCPAGCNGNVQANLFTYLFGPQVGIRSGKFRPYGQLLLGGAHSNFYANANTISGAVGTAPAGNTFALAVGGGFDIPLNHSGTIAIRPAEVDYLYTRFNISKTGAQSNFRYQAGFVFNFGR